jgi:hypothetical protein
MNGDTLMQLNETAMNGPEFLDALADQHRAQGLDVNAGIFRDRAVEWSTDKRTIASQAAELQNLRDRLNDVRRTLQIQ